MKWLGRLLFVLLAAIGAVWLFGPREPVDVTARFDPAKFGEGIGVYLESTEARLDGIKPGSEKRVVWAGQPETRTPLSIVYLHGFSANAEEIRPVPDRVAEALGANLVFTRYTGHGQNGAALARATVRDWMYDTAEAMALGRATGEEVILLTTSTGGTFAALAALDPEMSDRVKGIIFISPNFGINNPLAPLLTWPAARHWLPLVAGAERSFEPLNAGQAQHWTTRYPSTAVFPVAAIVKYATEQDYENVTVPALFYYADADQVVSAKATHRVASAWGGPVTIATPTLGKGMDPFAHVIAGDILSPAGTGPTVDLILNWIGGLQ
ncbi:MAG: alpha/beta fold hydrolase [Pseudomonadota bacterium]